MSNPGDSLQPCGIIEGWVTPDGVHRTISGHEGADWSAGGQQGHYRCRGTARSAIDILSKLDPTVAR